MQEIKLLPKDIIDEIAAGEVVEKPSAVVKELIENSIDANSNKVDIKIYSGGISKILITDNGCGIDKNYIDKAVKRYATSKFGKNSLQDIKTLGFRGEALYSISNSSNFKIISKTEYMNEAWMLKLSFGKVLKNRPNTGNNGTIVEVSDLFKNLPVRKKFLKSIRSEALAIRYCIKRIALAYPKITFSYYEDNKKKMTLLGSTENNAESLRIRDIIGEEFLKSSIYIKENFGDFNIKIYASIPTFNKSNWQQSAIIINGRVIQDKSLLGAIKAAYAGLIAGNRYPVVVLYININSNTLDINVHPSKSEVRILNRNVINSCIIKLIRAQLEKSGLRYSVSSERSLLKKFQNKDLSYQTKINISENILKKNMNGFQKQYTKEDDIKAENVYQLGFAKAQINKMFIVSQTQDSLILVDQHAAHERIVLENLKKNYFFNKVSRQMLLIPEVINLEQGKSYVIENKEQIYRLGFIFEDYGDNSLIVREIPAILGEININSLFQDLSNQLEQIGQINPMDTNIEKILSSIACHNSIRAGRKLNLEEMNSILRQMEKTPNSGQCNHGRPTFIELKLKDVESLFGRN